MFDNIFSKNKKNKASIVCIGSSCKDIFFPTEESVIIETPEDLTSQIKIAFELGAKYHIKEIYEAPGGTAANVAQGIARLGVSCGLHSIIGNDLTGSWIKDELKKENVELSLIQTRDDCRSDQSAIIIDTKGKDHVVFFNRDANKKLEVDTEKIKSFQWIFASALNGNWEKSIDDIIRASIDYKLKIAFNPGQENIKSNNEKIIQMIKMSEILILNKDEATEILLKNEADFSEEELKEEIFLLNRLKKMGPKIIVLTDGSRGAWGSLAEDVFHCERLVVEALDTLGAGDAFTSGFLAAHLKGKDLEQCLKWGIANGGNVVRFYGAKKGLLREKEIEIETENVRIKKYKI